MQELGLYHKWPTSVLQHWPTLPALRGLSGGLRGDQVLFRGPRLKLAISEGVPQAISPDENGRARYQGRSMQEAADICGSCAVAGDVACQADLAIKIVLRLNAAHASSMRGRDELGAVQEEPPPAGSESLSSRRAAVREAPRERASPWVPPATSCRTSLEEDSGRGPESHVAEARLSLSGHDFGMSEMPTGLLASGDFCPTEIPDVSFRVGSHLSVRRTPNALGPASSSRALAGPEWQLPHDSVEPGVWEELWAVPIAKRPPDQEVIVNIVPSFLYRRCTLLSTASAINELKSSSGRLPPPPPAEASTGVPPLEAVCRVPRLPVLRVVRAAKAAFLSRGGGEDTPLAEIFGPMTLE